MPSLWLTMSSLRPQASPSPGSCPRQTTRDMATESSQSTQASYLRVRGARCGRLVRRRSFSVEAAHRVEGRRGRTLEVRSAVALRIDCAYPLSALLSFSQPMVVNRTFLNGKNVTCGHARSATGRTLRLEHVVSLPCGILGTVPIAM